MDIKNSLTTSLTDPEDHSQIHWHATEVYGRSWSGAWQCSDTTTTSGHTDNNDDEGGDDDVTFLVTFLYTTRY